MAYDKRELAESVLNFSFTWPHTVENMTGTHAIYESMNDDERFGLSFGLFPVRLEEFEPAKEGAAEFIRLTQGESCAIR